jgi:hypothetical protein
LKAVSISPGIKAVTSQDNFITAEKLQNATQFNSIQSKSTQEGSLQEIKMITHEDIIALDMDKQLCFQANSNPTLAPPSHVMPLNFGARSARFHELMKECAEFFSSHSFSPNLSENCGRLGN